MSVPSSFNKNKRAVLLYSIATILLSLTQHIGDRLTQSVMEVPLSIRVSIAVIGLLLAAFYYAFGFVRDVEVARMINSEVVDGTGAEGLKVRLDQLASRLEEVGIQISSTSTQYLMFHTDMTRLGSDLVTAFQEPDRALERISNQAEPEFRSSLSHDPQLRQQMSTNPLDDFVQTRLRQMIEGAVAHQLYATGEAVRDIVSRLDDESGSRLMVNRAFEDSINSLESQIKRFTDRITRLSSRIDIGTRRMFKWWDVGTPLLLLCVATISALPSIRQFILEDAVKTIQEYGASFAPSPAPAISAPYRPLTGGVR